MPTPPRPEGWTAVALVAPVFLLFAILKAYGNYPAPSDENIYFYMAVRTAFDGLWPYRDYFFAHPPLHVLIGAAVLRGVALVYGALHGSLAAGVAMMTSGASWSADGLALGVAKAIPAASTLAAGLGIYRVTRRAGGPEAVVAAASFLLASQVLRASSHFTGVAEAAACTALGVASLVAGRDRAAALAFAAGCLVAMYVAPAAAAVWLVLLVIAPARARTVALWTALALLAVHGVFALVAGEAYWRGLVLYHLEKPTDVRAFSDAFWPLVYGNGHLFAALPLALVAGVADALGLLGFAAAAARVAPASRAARRRARGAPRPGHGSLGARLGAALGDLGSRARLRSDPRRQVLAFGVAGMVAQLLFLWRMNPVFEFYFVMVFVFAAVLAGYAYGAVLRAGALVVAALVRGERVLPVALAFLSLAGVGGGTVLWSRGETARRGEIDDAIVGLRLPRIWRPAPRLGPLDALVRRTLWRDEQVLGRHYPAVTDYLWHESAVFQAPVDAARYVSAETPPDATLFGDSYLAPLVALMTERRLALDEADTNPMRFMSGITPAAAMVARLERAPPAVVLADAGILAFGEFAAWLAASYTEVRTLDDPGYDEVMIYRRRHP